MFSLLEMPIILQNILIFIIIVCWINLITLSTYFRYKFIFGLMMTFIFMIFNIIIKAVYTFTASFFNLSILILISPIILPLMFFERTKRIFDTWLEYIADNIFKPMINFASLVIYTNFMDMILLKGVIFKNHSEKGRGAIVTCKDGNSSFLCLINGIPGVQQISILVN